MIVISDTTPLISLIKIDRLDLLEKLFGSVYIPHGVFDEVSAESLYEDEAELVKNADFIKIKDADSEKVSLLMRATGLDLGESEAIVLTETLNADLTLMDEVHGRTVAHRMGLHIMGTVGILGMAKEQNLISKDEIRQYIAVFKATGRHISEDLLNYLLNG
ncbi:MAG: DUF3368 domain-containing protein [Treponema sp.]|jgi:predicted nucleic acid-binding protein|nr:DUF3368 domain-containing protein [Treponema sp.]